jgi:hypothetical protein
MLRYALCVLAATLGSSAASAQAAAPPDSTAADSAALGVARRDSVSLLDRVTFEFGGANYYHMPESTPPSVTIDPALKSVRREDRRLGSVAANGRYDGRAGDSPLFHGAGYLSVAATVRPFDGFRVRGELVGEYRGSSYGVYDTRNTAVIPRVRFTFDTSATIMGVRVGAGVSTGHYVGLRFGEGLTLYNMDAIGTEIWIDVWKLRYYYEKVGDGAMSIGLNVDDFNADGIELRGLEMPGGLALRARAGGWSYPQVADLRYPKAGPRGELLERMRLRTNGLDGSLAVARDSVRVYAHGALRFAESDSLLVNRSALVVGASYALDDGRFSMSATAEYRYYGGLFNVGFANNGVAYQETGSNGVTQVGRYLYPLSGMDRPFSQWAVYTEYQDLKDVTGITLRARAKLFVWDRIMLRGDVDLNHVRAEKTAGKLYPFFDVGIGWEPVDGTSLVLSMTNKGMNLDRTYPTFYLYDEPAASVTIRWNR